MLKKTDRFMDEKIKRIAYIGMEIPALSATFIYNEIFFIEKENFKITPISVHFPNDSATGNDINELKSRTYFLYRNSIRSFLLANLRCMFRFTSGYFKTLLMSIFDSIKTGIFSHTGKGILYRFFTASKAAEIIAESGCRHIHSHFAHISTDIAMYASGISGIPFSFTSHANDLFQRGWLLKEKVERSRFAVTISEYNQRFLLNNAASLDKIHVIHCGVDTESFKPRTPVSISGIPKIGTIGRMVEKKGFDTLIDACEKLYKKGQPFHLEIAGSGPLQNDLQKYVNDKNLSDRISFIGALPHVQISNWLKSKDIFVLPCKRDKHGDMDGIPVVLMEAMAMGVPVITSRISGIPELVEDGITGILIEENDAETLSESVIKIVSDTWLRDSIIKNGIEKVRNDFCLSKNVKILSDLFRGAIS
jgi:colanic acid/amylovoran biosynthesis glycosyltransferase